jgi:glyoxylase-like metal-dependent hydrolase (beta-lactamase superfamily II)
MRVEARFDAATFTITYVVYDEASRDAVVIDPVLDYDPLASRTSLSSAEQLLQWIRGQDLRVRFVLETHAHADHLSASRFLAAELGAPVAVGEHIRSVQKTFAPVFGFDEDFPTVGSQFDRLLRGGEHLAAGSLDVEVIHTPGHTPACVSYRIGDAVFVGDALFMPDYGTGRCDFPGGSADELYTSVHDKLYALPDATRVFVGHDYQPGGREVRWQTTIGESKLHNIQLRASTSREQFVRFRKERDATLSAPRLMFPSVQVNICAGRLPHADRSGIRHLRIPLDLQRATDEAGRPAPAEKAPRSR